MQVKRKILTMIMAVMMLMSCLMAVSVTYAEEEGIEQGDTNIDPSKPQEFGNLFWDVSEDGILTMSGVNSGYFPPRSSASEYPWYAFRERVVKIVVKECVSYIPEDGFADMPNLTEIELPATLANPGGWGSYGMGNRVFSKGMPNLVSVKFKSKFAPIIGANIVDTSSNSKVVLYVPADGVNYDTEVWKGYTIRKYDADGNILPEEIINEEETTESATQPDVNQTTGSVTQPDNNTETESGNEQADQAAGTDTKPDNGQTTEDNSKPEETPDNDAQTKPETNTESGSSNQQQTPAVDTLPAKGAVKAVGNQNYKVLVSSKTKGTVEFAGIVKSKKASVKSVKIPDTVKIEGYTFKVVSIAKNAFSGCKKLTSVVIGKNVAKIGAKAFYKNGKLKSITISSTKLTAKNVGASAFKGINAKCVVKAPKAKVKNYQALLKAKGAGKSVKVKKK